MEQCGGAGRDVGMGIALRARVCARACAVHCRWAERAIAAMARHGEPPRLIPRNPIPVSEESAKIVVDTCRADLENTNPTPHGAG